MVKWNQNRGIGSAIPFTSVNGIWQLNMWNKYYLA